MSATVIENTILNSISSATTGHSDSLEILFTAIRQGQSENVRKMVTSDRTLCRQKRRGDYRYPLDVEIDGYNLLGAYLNPLTPLQYAILLGFDEIAVDLIDASFQEDLEITFGIGNTALHLATLVGSHKLVKLLLERGCNTLVKNKKGISPLDVVDDAELRAVFDDQK